MFNLFIHAKIVHFTQKLQSPVLGEVLKLKGYAHVSNLKIAVLQQLYVVYLDDVMMYNTMTMIYSDER